MKTYEGTPTIHNVIGKIMMVSCMGFKTLKFLDLMRAYLKPNKIKT